MVAGTLTDSPVSAVVLLDAAPWDGAPVVSTGAAPDVLRGATPGRATTTQVSTFSASLTAEFDGARAALEVTAEELLLGALCGAMARSVGQGTLAVDRIDCRGGVRRIVLDCVDHRGVAADETLVAVRRLLDGARDTRDTRAGSMPGAVVRVDLGGPEPTDEDIAHYALLLHGDRDAHGALRLTWRYDPTRLLGTTVADLREQWPSALIELTSHAVPGFSDDAPAGIDTL